MLHIAEQAYPTIVVEMYVNFPADDGFVQDASDSIKSAIECHILSPRAASITRYTTGTLRKSK